MPNVENKTIIVTGASRGIGEAAGRHLANVGARVVLAATSGNRLTDIAEDINSSGGTALPVVCDVSDFESVHSLANAATEFGGSIDGLVNNAGLIEPIARIEDSDPTAWARVIDVNLKGPYNCIRACLPTMLPQGGGTIINISSGAATGALEGWSHYCATKAALLSLTKCTHKEVGNKGIRVLGLSPGTVATEMQTQIKASGINPVSQLDPSVHIPADWVAKAIAYLFENSADKYLGTDFSLKTEEGLKAAGLPAQ